MQCSLPFALRDRAGTVRIRVAPNRDPEEVGHPLVAVGYDRGRFVGFPVVEALVSYEGAGWRAWMGWLQVIERVDDDGTVAVDVDVPPCGAGSPMYTFGYRPGFFDAPANPDHPDGRWNAYTFLVAVPDVVRSEVLHPITGFRWGYRLLGGEPVEIFEPTPLPVGKWDALRDFLTGCFPSWSFLAEQE